MKVLGKQFRSDGIVHAKSGELAVLRETGEIGLPEMGTRKTAKEEVEKRRERERLRVRAFLRQHYRRSRRYQNQR